MKTTEPEPIDSPVGTEDPRPATRDPANDLRRQAHKPATRTDRFGLRALYETSRLLSASLDLDFVLENLLLTAMSKLLTTRGVVVFYDPLDEACRVTAVKGGAGFERGERVPLEPPSANAVLHEDDVPSPLRAHGMTLALPITHGYRKIGWLALGAKATGQPFAAHEMEFIRSLVNMSSAAVHNALLVGELQQANRDLDAKVQALNTLFDLSQEFNTTLDRRRLVKLLSFALMGQMAVQRHLFLLRRDAEVELEVVAARGIRASAVTEEQRQALCGLETLVRLEADGEEPASWQALRNQGLDLILPIRHQGQTCAVLGLGPKLTETPYTPGDVEFLYALGNLAFVSIQNTYLVEEQIEKRRMEEEMRLARDMQERLLPAALPPVPGATLAARNVPSREVGGDYYDVMELSEGRLLLAIADVTGKGVPAALLMANLQACLHALGPVEMSLEEGTARVNRVICENTDAATFITFFCAIYYPGEQRLDYVNAGHNPPLVLRASGVVDRLETGGLLLGVLRSAPYEQGTVSLAPGDVLACFTDGATEAMNAAEEEYEEGRLIDCLKRHRNEEAGAILEAVRADIRAFAGESPFLDDDLTLLVLRVSERASG